MALSNKAMFEQETFTGRNMSSETLNSALSLYILAALMDNSKSSSNHRILCSNEPELFGFMSYLNELFPNSRFVYMVRDPRAQIAHSTRADPTKDHLKIWDMINTHLLSECQTIGHERCLIVRYEDLVMFTRATLKKVSRFLGWKFVTGRFEYGIVNKSMLNEWEDGMREFDGAYLPSRIRKVFGYGHLKTYGYGRIASYVV
jgi:hypothetical protein